MTTARRLHLRVDERTEDMLEYLENRLNTPTMTALIQVIVGRMARELGWREGWRQHE